MSPAAAAEPCRAPVSVCADPTPGSFPLIRAALPATILVDAGADPAVRHVVASFAGDLQRVSGTAARVITNPKQARGATVIIGVLGASPILDGLARRGLIPAQDIAGQWEAYRQIVIDRPLPGVPRALVIIGSDRRGAVYGAYDLSEKIGVSPWYWFADVPVAHRTSVYLTAGNRRDQPKVRYRGFFINDEAPSFATWAQTHFGGANARMYEHVFELDLRLKGDFLWPAMWAPRAFAADDRENMVLADQMGVVMGTSHHEPMMRAQDEWHRPSPDAQTGGAWDYTTNAPNLRAFWRGGIARMMSKGDGTPYESVVTVGMRGDGDEPMAEGTATQLLERIVADQRSIIADVTGKPAAQTPQVWALYKEVQDYYDHGMKVPDDVTLLFSDDNWGELRRLPTTDLMRAGGFGIYYHFDYVGDPRNYKWVNTNQIEKVWQQMEIAYARGVRSLWIVNVGDIKPMEFPLSFFMKQAWDPTAMTRAALARFPADWAAATFGPTQAGAIGGLLTRYSQMAAARKPELLDASSFPLGAVTPALLDGGTFGQAVARWQDLVGDMQRVKHGIAPEQQDAFFQLVEHPILALANLYQLYYDVAWNGRLATMGDRRANVFADRARADYARDAAITAAYHQLNGGKWNGMMLQTHIGYTGWQQPDRQVMPDVQQVAGPGPLPAVKFEAAPTSAGAERTTIIEATDPIGNHAARGLAWQPVAHLGQNQGAMVTLPQGRPSTTQADGIHVDYPFAQRVAGPTTVRIVLAPTLATDRQAGVRIGVSVDDGPMQVLVEQLEPTVGGVRTPAQTAWVNAVEQNAVDLDARFDHLAAGRHLIKVWRLDDNAVLERLEVTPAS